MGTGLRLCLLFLCVWPLQRVSAAQRPAEELWYGKFVREVTGLSTPSAVAFTPAGDWWVVETGHHRLSRFSLGGEPQQRLGQRGSAAGEFCFPSGVAVAADGRLWVADTGNHRLQVFSPQGEWLRSLGRHGSGPGQFLRPRWVVVGEDQVVVVDEGARRVQVLSLDGEPLAAVDALSSPEVLAYPTGVALGNEGQIFVADAVAQRLVELDVEGNLQATHGGYGGYPGLFSSPLGLAFAQDLLFVVDSQNHRLQLLTAAGQVHQEFGKPEIRPYEGRGRLQIPTDVAVSPDAEHLVVSEPQAGRCQLFTVDPDYQPTDKIQGPSRNVAEPHYAPYLAVLDQRLVLTDSEFQRVLLHDIGKKPVQRLGFLGSAGHKTGQLMQARGCCLLAGGSEIVVADAGHQRLQWFGIRDRLEADRYRGDRGAFLRSLQLNALDLPQELRGFPMQPETLVRHPAGGLVVLEANHEVVVHLGEDLSLLRFWGGHGNGPGQFRRPTDLCFGPAGDVLYVVDSHNRRLQEFSALGQHRRTWERAGNQDLVEPFGVAVAASGDVFVSDAGSHQVHQFTADGTWRRSFGGRGLKAGEFFQPKGLAITVDQRLLVVDQGNRRCQIFAADGTFLDLFGVGWYVRAAFEDRTKGED